MADDPVTINHVTDVLPEGIEREDREAPGDLVEHTSFSRLETYLRCGFKYMLKYELKVQVPKTLNLTRGKAGHKALEAAARHKIATGTDMPVEQMLDTFNDQFNHHLLDTELTPRDDPDREKDAVIEALTIYQHKYAKHVTPLAVEVEFLMPLPERENAEPVPPILGFIDEIRRERRQIMPRARKTERTAIIDHKFPGKKPSNSLERAILSPQLTIYDWVFTAAGKPPDDIGFQFFIPPTKTIEARIEPVYRPPELMTPAARATRHARVELMMRRTYRAINRGDTYIPKDDPTICSSCEYRKVCQYSLAADDYLAEKLTPESFKI